MLKLAIIAGSAVGLVALLLVSLQRRARRRRARWWQWYFHGGGLAMVLMRRWKGPRRLTYRPDDDRDE